MKFGFGRKAILRVFAAFAMLVAFVGAYGYSPASAKTTSTITIHYNRPDGNYTGWNMWIWFPGFTSDYATEHGLIGSDGNSSRNLFNGQDAYGKKLTLTLTDLQDVKKIGFIVRKDDWTKDVGSDRFITEFDANGNAEIWLRSTIAKVYNTVPCLCAEIYSATQDDYRTINVTLSETFRGVVGDTGNQGWTISDGLNIVSVTPKEAGKTIRTTRSLTLTTDQDMELGKTYTITNTRTFAVTGMSAKSNVATLTTASATGVSPGQTVIVKNVDGRLNGVVKVVASPTPTATPAPYTISYSKVTMDITQADASGAVETGFGSAPVVIGAIYNSSLFAERYTYTGNDLGNTWTAGKTDFRVWAPTATDVKLLTFGNALDPNSITTEPVITDMTASEKGTWVGSLSGDQHGLIYQYRVWVNGEIHDSIDPYARSAMANGTKGVVLDLSKTNPSGWTTHKKPTFSGKSVDASVYEIHVRDFSVDASSGIPDNHKGKFLAFTDLGTKYSTKVGTKTVSTNTGLSAIKELGVTHVELLPIYDFNSVNETPAPTASPQFNWGYDPQNFNIPEGSYSTDANNPIARVMELKQAIQSMHSNGLRVVMDVVYPHVGSANDFSQNLIVPGYFYRTEPNGELANGSGCGNEIASERPMVRKFITDSFKYWTSEYKMDGYRLDQMGLMDITTVNGIRSEIDSIDPSVITYGEGWNIGDVLPIGQKAAQPNISQIPKFGVFNDQIRDAIKGNTGNLIARGWISGDTFTTPDVQTGITGNIDFSLDLYPNFTTVSPGQSVNYVEAHDNHTLYDKLKASAPGSDEKIAKMVRQAGALMIFAQGMPFIHAGQEFLRTKDGNGNSYNAPDAINSLKYTSRLTHATTVKYYAGLIKLRKQHPAFRMWTANQVKANLRFIGRSPDLIAYRLNGKAMGDSWKTIVVASNNGLTPSSVSLPATGNWELFVSGSSVSTDPKKPLKTLKKVYNLIVPAGTTVVAVKN
ncbi:MAG: type I pullulanase [Actinomycetales bacterium]|nr:type I pullulanase [Actinomycetales bacterium]